MSVTVSSLYNDSFNFFKNQSSKFILLALIVTVIQVLLGLTFQPDITALFTKYGLNLTQVAADLQPGQEIVIDQQTLMGMIQQLSPEQQLDFAKDALTFSLPFLLLNTLMLILLITWTISFSMSVIQGDNASIPQAITRSLPILPKVITFTLIYLILLSIGFTLFIVPGIMIYFALALAPFIIIATNSPITTAMSDSLKLLMRYPAIVIMGVLLSVALPLLVGNLVTAVLSQPVLNLFVQYFLNSIITIFFTLYFFRFLSLIYQKA